MNRRGFLGALAGLGVVGAATRVPMATVEIHPCAMDLCTTSLRAAMEQAGIVEAHEAYLLTVHPVAKGWAIEAMLHIPEAHFMLAENPTFTYVDEWTLVGRDRRVHSNGA